MLAPATLTVKRRRELEQLLARKRRRHPELRRPTIAGVRRVYKREDITLKESATLFPRRLGCAFGFRGCACVMIAREVKRWPRLAVLLHELAHVWLHVHNSPKAELAAGSPAFVAVETQCELEADFVAERLLGVTAMAFRARVKAAGHATSPPITG
jgi:hypothetical protein